MSHASIERVLLVEDNPGDARLLREMFNEQGSRATALTHVESLAEAEKHLAKREVDITLLDLGLPDAQGLAAVKRIQAAAPGVPLVVLTGLDDESVAVQALQEGAQDYLVKGQIETRGLLRAMRYAAERKVMEERHRNLMEHANDAILLLRPDLRILEVNRRAEELLGCSREQIVGRTYESFIPPDDLLLLEADRASLLALGATRLQDRRLLRTDGFMASVDVSASLVQDGDEKVVLAILHDTSQRKRGERELTAARDRLRLVVSSSPAVLYTLNVVGETLRPAWVSDNVEQVIGYRPEEVNQEDWWAKCLHPEERDRVLGQVSELLETGHIEREYRVRRKDGAYTWVQDSQKLLKDQKGNSTEVVGSWSDVSVRKGAERRLLESAEEYRLLFDSNPHPMWVFDVETLAFLAVNDAAIQVYGFSRDEFLGMTVAEIRSLPTEPDILEHPPAVPSPKASRKDR